VSQTIVKGIPTGVFTSLARGVQSVDVRLFDVIGAKKKPSFSDGFRELNGEERENDGNTCAFAERETAFSGMAYKFISNDRERYTSQLSR